MQHAGIAAEAINQVNKGLYKAIYSSPDTDLHQPRDLYEVTASLAMVAQRLQLTPDDLKRVTRAWHEQDCFASEAGVDTARKVQEFTDAMTRAQGLARDLFIAYREAASALSRVGSARKVPEPARKPELAAEHVEAPASV